MTYQIYENLVYSELSDGTLGLGNTSTPSVDKNALTESFVVPRHLVLPSSINGKTVSKILERALKGVIGITSVDLPHTLKEIKQYGMCDLQSLKTLVIPASVEVLGTWSISGMKNCKSLIFEAGSKLRVVGNGAFDHYLAEEIVLPPSITSFAAGTLCGWSRLKRVYICSENVFNNNTETFDSASAKAVVYAPMSYKGEFFGGKRVTKIKDCCLIMRKPTLCSFKHSARKQHFELYTTILILSIH